MHTLTLKLSNAELQALRTALANYACLACREGRACSAVGAAVEAGDWSAAEVAAVDVLSRMPRVPSLQAGRPAPII